VESPADRAAAFGAKPDPAPACHPPLRFRNLLRRPVFTLSVRFLNAILVLVFVLAGCSEEKSISPAQPEPGGGTTSLTEALAWSIVEEAGWLVEASAEELSVAGMALCQGPHGPIYEFERVPITEEVALYSMQIRVGDGPYDIMGLHRVVKERRPHVPIRAKRSVMFVHGSPGLFRQIFLTGLYSPTVPADHALPVALAEDGIDVWGVDLRWTLVPEETTDFEFMADWNTAVDIGDMSVALGTARLVRLLTGNGFRKMQFLGYSYGGYLGYAYLNMETQRPPGHRHVSGFVNVDYHFKTDCPECMQAACDFADYYDWLYSEGYYADNWGAYARDLGRLARLDPDSPSQDPYYAGFTNYQAALASGSGFEGEYSFVPGYHLVTGVFDEEGHPNSLLNVSDDFWLDFIELWSSYTPTLCMAELLKVACGSEDLPYDDHLGEITVPVLYVGAGGGFGEYGLYTLTLLGSSDITTHIVDVEPDPEERLLDYGHVDLIAGQDAPQWSWPVIRAWLAEH
jgi:pimeloyl-ACP methyl ester carboxylesterase